MLAISEKMKVMRKWMSVLSATFFAFPLASQGVEGIRNGVHAEHDPAFGQTILHLDKTMLDSVTHFSALATFRGRNTTAPPVNEVVVVTFWLRDKRSFGRGIISASISTDQEVDVWTGRAYSASSGSAQALMVAIPFTQWIEFSKARHPAFSLGPHTYRLDEAAVEALREFCRRIES
jgi:hypothetical protein